MSKPEHIVLTELKYSTDVHGPLKPYIFNRDWMHKGRGLCGDASL